VGEPLHTIMVERLGCRWPIIQTAMGWVAEPSLVIGSSNAGAFGFLGAAVMTPDEAREKLLAVRRGTDRPFGVNFHSFQPGAEQIVDLIIENKEQVRAVSFGRGPDAKMIGRFKDAGILCVPTVGAVKHAQKMVQLGVDMVNVQGGEGGGHTGSVPTTVLLPQVLDAVKVPVIASGGIADGRGIAAAFALGAAGVQLGSAYLRCPESRVIAPARVALAAAGDDTTVITNVMTGRLARGVANRVMREVGPVSPDAPAFPHAATALTPLKVAAEKLGRVDFTNLWAGQAIGLGRELPAAELTRVLAAEALARMGQLAG
jgi:NAD(P)H-dependent flavin oxidoreductase YrpB (nitropropane dioxygenase family)